MTKINYKDDGLYKSHVCANLSTAQLYIKVKGWIQYFDKKNIYKTKKLLRLFFASIYYVINIYPIYFIWLMWKKRYTGGTQATQTCFKNLVTMVLISIGRIRE